MKSFGLTSHGTAVWVSRMAEKVISNRFDRTFHGLISSQRMLTGYDVDDLVRDLWRFPETHCPLTYMETHLMLASGKVILIKSQKIEGEVSCLGLVFDEAYYPSGLTGRLLNELLRGENSSGKEESETRGAGIGRQPVGCSG